MLPQSGRMEIEMTVIGLTGPTGSGKGKVAEILSEYKIQHIDADAVYHNLLVPPSPCLDDIVEEFGYGVLNPGGQLDRRALSDIVFAEHSDNKLEKLNKITHKYVCARIRQIIRYFESIDTDACVIDAPLLFESGLDSDCNFVICVLADSGVRAQRISQRDGMEIEQAMMRISSQKSDNYYADRATYTLYNNGDENELRNNILGILKKAGLGGIV